MRTVFFSSVLFLLSLAHTASAHVGYVIDAKTLTENEGGNLPLFFSALTYGKNIFLILLVLGVVWSLWHLLHRFIIVEKELAYIKKRLLSYSDLIPWILRLGLGITFMGAAAHHVYMSPLLPDVVGFAGLELIIGFAILAGFLLTPALLLILSFFIVAVAQNFYVLGSTEIVGGVLSLLLLADGRPGFDDIIGIKPFLHKARLWLVPIILRLTLGGTFIFLAFYEKILNPRLFLAVVEKYNLTSVIHVSPDMWLFAVGSIELFIGLCILLGFRTRLFSVIAFLVVASTFFYFKESVYSHVTLFSTMATLFITGSGALSIDSWYAHKQKAVLPPVKTKKVPARKPRKKKVATA